MLCRVERDLEYVPAVAAPYREWQQYLEGVRQGLSRGWRVSGRRRVELKAAIALVTDRATWERLTEAGLSDARAAGVAARMVSRIAEEE